MTTEQAIGTIPKFLGEPVEFWIKVRAALRKARISTIEDLEARLGVTPPTYGVEPDIPCGRWVILCRRNYISPSEIVGWSESEKDARLICSALTASAGNA